MFPSIESLQEISLLRDTYGAQYGGSGGAVFSKHSGFTLETMDIAQLGRAAQVRVTADRTAIITALKQVLGLLRVMDNPDSNAIIIRDTPEKVLAAEEMVRQLDRAKAEIMLDINIVEADRDRLPLWR